MVIQDGLTTITMQTFIGQIKVLLTSSGLSQLKIRTPLKRMREDGVTLRQLEIGIGE